MMQSWGTLKSNNEKLFANVDLKDGYHSIGRTNCVGANTSMPKTLFAIERKLIGHHPEPVYLTNQSERQEVYVYDEALLAGQQRILLLNDKISKPPAAHVFVFYDYRYPTLGDHDYLTDFQARKNFYACRWRISYS